MKTAAALTLLAAIFIFSSLVGTLFINTSEADSALLPPLPSAPDKNELSIAIYSPENNKTYNVNNVSYSLTVKKPSSWFNEYPVHGTIMLIAYTVDQNQRVPISSEPAYYEQGPFTFKGTLTGLSEGMHNIQVYVRSDSFYNQNNRTIGKADDYYLDTYSDWINFTIDTITPTISSLSIENRTYGATEVPLNFAVSEVTSGITYCLDSVSNVTIVGNTTLTGLSTGAHNVTVYAWDTAGNVGASQTVDFTVSEEPAPPPAASFPSLLVAAMTVAVAVVVAVAVLVYLKKRRR